jgi:hypothetical protein
MSTQNADVANKSRVGEDGRLLNPREKLWLAVFVHTDKLKCLLDESAKDVDAMVQLLRIEPSSQVVRRTLVRNFAAHVDGFAYGLKQVTLALSRCSRAGFTSKELARLSESKSYLDANGQEKRLRFSGFIKNLHFAFKEYAKVNGFAFELDCNDARYRYFQQMVQVRNRLMHPKSLKTFAVSDEEITQIGEVRGWFNEQASSLLRNHAPSNQFERAGPHY